MRILGFIFLLLVIIGAILFFRPGAYLIVNNPQPSDAIVSLGGDQGDARYLRGLELLRAGYGQHLYIDIVPGQVYGRSVVELAQEFVLHTAGANAPQISVCLITVDSTKGEAPEAAACIRQLQPTAHSGIVVTDNYHTRRALSIFRDRDRQYRWTAAAANTDAIFGVPWWKHREWAKTYVLEVQKLVWWEIWDRWTN